MNPPFDPRRSSKTPNINDPIICIIEKKDCSLAYSPEESPDIPVGRILIMYN
jgi:hypothetical protein